MKENQLHVLLAVEGDLQGQAKRVIKEAYDTFKSKLHLFDGLDKVLHMFDEKRQQEESAGRQHSDVATTVEDKLRYIKGAVGNYWDAVLQKENANQDAQADLVIDGKTIAPGLPATFLLGMESKVKALREVFEAIPTRDPNISWIAADDIGPGVFKSVVPIDRTKTETIVEPVVLYHATKDHPAQVKEGSKVVTIGKTSETKYTSRWTPLQKSNALARVDKLIRSLKKARQKANQTEIKDAHIANDIFKYLLEGKLPG